jgi:aspartate kinase
LEKIKIGGMLQGKGLAGILVTGIPGHRALISGIFRPLARNGINIDFIVHTMDERGQAQVAFCVDRKDLQESLSLLEEHREEIRCTHILHRRDAGVISIFGPHFRERPGIAVRFFNALDAAKITILAISTSISTISALVEQKDMPEAVAALDKVFEMPSD